ncbi:MAG: flagellar transcriptional regulator FlhD [Gammaproteobacteria bacterium]|nr:flagellar transcriptional regulator FlhD [Gammaproteobacteria bacterium]MDH5653000.1 flagellar transcriptional regulator FlhD [Gammaproteobacteria bacterium]
MELKNPDYDFSDINLQYLLRARDLAIHDPAVVAALLGIPTALAQTLAQTTPNELVLITKIKLPLLVPRQDNWWWTRLLTALRLGEAAEIDVVLEHGIVTSQVAEG